MPQDLHAGGRQHVHVSFDAAIAIKVGQRHGEAVVLEVRAAAMHAAGYQFYLSANGVWLTERAPVECLNFPDAD